MARITISDDLTFVNNKYELGMLAGQRVRDLNGGEQPVVSVPGNEKATVTALREIASGGLDVDGLRSEFVQSYKKVPVADENTETLESNAVAPELKELDDELSGALKIKDQVAEEIADQSEGTETPESVEDGEGVVDQVAE